MRLKMNKLSDVILNFTIFSIAIISILVVCFVISNLSVASQSKAKVEESQTYTRFNSCAIAQRSYRGAAALNRAELDYCWDMAERGTNYKVDRYYGSDVK